MTEHVPSLERYDRCDYRRSGRSGLMLPPVSLGLWHNFGGVDCYETGRAIIRQAFDAGVTHFDLANNYGPPPGSAEETLGKLLRDEFRGYRDELIISSKAGYRMWPGPYGEWGSRKYLLASLDQSLRRMKLPYVDIFYSHRLDPQTPLEETMGALASAVQQGKAIYVGISNYPADETRECCQILKELGTPCVIHQPRYSLLDRAIETDGLLEVLSAAGAGCIVYSPLAQGLLTDRYLSGIPADSRAAKPHGFLRESQVTTELLARVRRLNEMASQRGQSLAQMALAWLLRDPRVTSVLIGASSVEQLRQNLASVHNTNFREEECAMIDRILT